MCPLQPMTGEVMSGISANIQDGARLDIAADGFWGLRCRLAYSLLRSSVMCIRGALTLAIICLLHNLLTWCQEKPSYLHNRFSYFISFFVFIYLCEYMVLYVLVIIIGSFVRNFHIGFDPDYEYH